MKPFTLVILLLVYYAECRKILPLDKNANTAFINMEGGGGSKPVAKNQNQAYPTVSKLVQSVGPAPVKPATVPAQVPAPVKPAQVPAKPAQVPQKPAPAQVPVKSAQAPVPAPAKPAQQPSQPVPVNAAPVSKPVTTPGPGTVKQLVNFYDSQGKASPIRPYSYSQAVKQG